MRKIPHTQDSPLTFICVNMARSNLSALLYPSLVMRCPSLYDLTNVIHNGAQNRETQTGLSLGMITWTGHVLLHLSHSQPLLNLHPLGIFSVIGDSELICLRHTRARTVRAGPSHATGGLWLS